MASLVNRIQRFARSEKGQRLIAMAKRKARDPRVQRKARRMLKKLNKH